MQYFESLSNGLVSNRSYHGYPTRLYVWSYGTACVTKDSVSCALYKSQDTCRLFAYSALQPGRWGALHGWNLRSGAIFWHGHIFHSLKYFSFFPKCRSSNILEYSLQLLEFVWRISDDWCSSQCCHSSMPSPNKHSAFFTMSTPPFTLRLVLIVTKNP